MVAQYRIKVHSMKSTANLIGATVIGGMAKFLEDAARREELVVLDTLHPIFIKEWRSYKEKLAECIKAKGVMAESKESLEEALFDLTKERKEKTIAFGSLYFIGEIEEKNGI